ncbi:phage tail assembly protein [uncultured Rikenella sp.]|uniref:phage tail assembly protein n=1 Tax=uncultured Rikenella sp. TaxID=368003 RepID=UPI0025DFAE4C|nr:phage tail assembly protein [uncultured Rikenella sp.]
MSKIKITVEKNPGKLAIKNVTVREPLVEDLLEAQKFQDNARMSMALISQICTFDGRRLTLEELEQLPLSDFLELSAELAATGLVGSAEQFSALSATAVSDSPKSGE